MPFYLPEENEILQHCECDVEAIQEAVPEEQDEEFVVGKVDAIVHPWAWNGNQCVSSFLKS